MRVLSGSTILSAAVLVFASVCLATSGSLRKATEQQQAALAAQKSAQEAALATERSERAAQDSALKSDLGMVRGDIQALRTELQTLRTDFGAKIAMVEAAVSGRSAGNLPEQLQPVVITDRLDVHASTA